MKPEYTRHGGANDRGRADAWYLRPYNPHYYERATMSSPKIEQKYMTQEEIQAYTLGFEEVMVSGFHKEYG